MRIVLRDKAMAQKERDDKNKQQQEAPKQIEQKPAENNTQKNESALDSVMRYLLSEDSTKVEGGDKAASSGKNMYETVNAKVIAALTNIFSMKTKKEIKFLLKLIPSGK